MAQREQLNLRLPAEWFEVLGIAAVLEDATITDYVKEMIGQRVVSLRLDDDVAAVLRRKAKRSARRDGNVASLDERREDKEA
jgi:hypothetical protein